MASLKMVSLNIEGEKHLDTVIPFLQKERPDVVCLQEVLEKDLPIIKQALSMEGDFVPCIYINEENLAGFPIGHTVGICVLTNLIEYGTSVYFYEGEADEKLRNLGNVNPNAFFRMLLAIEVKKGEEKFRIINTHFTWTPNGKTSDLQKEHLARMQQKLHTYDSFVLCGDFNAPRGEEIWEILAKEYTDNIPSDVLSTLDPNLHRSKKLDLVVDGVFSTAGYVVSNVSVIDGLSDHKAVIATISHS